jgi:hypothetical protein
MVDASEKLNRPVLDTLTAIETASSGADRDTNTPPHFTDLAGSFIVGVESCQGKSKE